MSELEGTLGIVSLNALIFQVRTLRATELQQLVQDRPEKVWHSWNRTLGPQTPQACDLSTTWDCFTGRHLSPRVHSAGLGCWNGLRAPTCLCCLQSQTAPPHCWGRPVSSRQEALMLQTPLFQALLLRI